MNVVEHFRIMLQSRNLIMSRPHGLLHPNSRGPFFSCSFSFSFSVAATVMPHRKTERVCAYSILAVLERGLCLHDEVPV